MTSHDDVRPSRRDVTSNKTKSRHRHRYMTFEVDINTLYSKNPTGYKSFHEFKQSSACTELELKRVLLSVTVRPACENNLSLGTDVAWMHKKSQAMVESTGNLAECASQYANGSKDDTGSPMYC
ncbi:hypothetical protein GEMRC1_014081 [Eukaryota sp. GEM-RC1]